MGDEDKLAWAAVALRATSADLGRLITSSDCTQGVRFEGSFSRNGLLDKPGPLSRLDSILGEIRDAMLDMEG